MTNKLSTSVYLAFMLPAALLLTWSFWTNPTGPTAYAQPANLAPPGMVRLSWRRNLRNGLSEAQKSNKLVLVDVYTGWCGWCKRLDRDTYSNPNVVQFLNRSFVCVKMDAEDGAEGQSMARRYQIKGYPCIMILDPSGAVRGLFYGYRDAREFPKAVTAALGSQTGT